MSLQISIDVSNRYQNKIQLETNIFAKQPNLSQKNLLKTYIQISNWINIRLNKFFLWSSEGS